MKEIVKVLVDQETMLEICRERVSELISEADLNLVFWDSSELKRRTCMSWNTVQATFFFDERFTRRKIGGKWYFPARETRAFLEIWLREQQ